MRGDLPSQFASAFERAGGLARKGGDGLKRHYEFLLEAQELRARYAELLARAPIVTEKGKQFLARLELERRAEQFRETSGGVSDWARQKVVLGIATSHQGTAIHPGQDHAAAEQAACHAPGRRREDRTCAGRQRIRRAFPGSAAACGCLCGRKWRREQNRRQCAGQEIGQGRSPGLNRYTKRSRSNRGGRLRDLVTGDAALGEYGADVAEAPRPKAARPASAKARVRSFTGFRTSTLRNSRSLRTSLTLSQGAISRGRFIKSKRG